MDVALAQVSGSPLRDAIIWGLLERGPTRIRRGHLPSADVSAHGPSESLHGQIRLARD